MKKFLLIMVLCLIFNSKAFAENIYLNCNRIIYENNGSGDWSSYYKVGNTADGSVLIKIQEKNTSIKMTVHLTEMDDGNPEKMFTGKGSIKDGHYIVKKKHSGKIFIKLWMLNDHGVTKIKASDKIDLSKKEDEWVIDGEGIRKFDVIDVSYKYRGECSLLTKDEYLKASK
jgi:hypothetical protein